VLRVLLLAWQSSGVLSPTATPYPRSAEPGKRRLQRCQRPVPGLPRRRVPILRPNNRRPRLKATPGWRDCRAAGRRSTISTNCGKRRPGSSGGSPRHRICAIPWGGQHLRRQNSLPLPCRCLRTRGLKRRMATTGTDNGDGGCCRGWRPVWLQRQSSLLAGLASSTRRGHGCISSWAGRWLPLPRTERNLPLSHCSPLTVAERVSPLVNGSLCPS